MLDREATRNSVSLESGTLYATNRHTLFGQRLFPQASCHKDQRVTSQSRCGEAVEWRWNQRLRRSD